MNCKIHSRNSENPLRIGSGLRVALALFAVIGDALAVVHYVSPVSPTPAAPYTTWTSAARNIQDAVDAASSGDTILVTNGVYATGGRAWLDSLMNRVAITQPLVVQSVNGPLVTVIQGNRTIGNSAVRCVYLTSNARLIGFTLADGGTHNTGNSWEQSGAGAWCDRSNAVISGCIFTNNTANSQGGGVANGILNNCLLIGNSASLGGALAALDGFLATANNCTIVSNSASTGGGGVASIGGAGLAYLLARNCIITDNSAPTGPNYLNSSKQGITMDYCCTTPVPPAGSGNFTNSPLFVNPVAGKFHLQTNSPCINAGNNLLAIGSVDLDGSPRIVGGTVDIGAYESQLSGSLISYAWLQQYGLPTDGSADALDPDGDGMNNWREWIAGTVPTNAASVLKMLSPSRNASGLQLTWQSVTGKTYFLQRSTNLAVQPAFLTIQSNHFGQTNTTAFTDSAATNQTPYFYRVGVQ